MTHICRCGRPLNLRWEGAGFEPDRSFLWITFNKQCDECWHKTHVSPVETCLFCHPPQALEAA